MAEVLLERQLTQGLTRQPKPAPSDSYAGPDQRRSRLVQNVNATLPSSSAPVPAANPLGTEWGQRFTFSPDPHNPLSWDEIQKQEQRKANSQARDDAIEKGKGDAARWYERYKASGGIDGENQRKLDAIQYQNQRAVEQGHLKEAREAQWRSESAAREVSRKVAEGRLSQAEAAAELEKLNRNRPSTSPVDKSPPAQSRPSGPDTRPSTPRTGGFPLQPLREAPQIAPAQPRTPVKSAGKPFTLLPSSIPKILPRLAVPVLGGALDFTFRVAGGQPVPAAAFGTGGTIAGGLIGAGLGTVVAGPIGGFVGGFVGSYVGGALADALFPNLFASPEKRGPKFYQKPPFNGGQSAGVPYLVRFHYVQNSSTGAGDVDYTTRTWVGPINTASQSYTSYYPGDSQEFYITHQGGEELLGQRGTAYGKNYNAQGKPVGGSIGRLVIDGIVRVDGQPDTGGNPPPLSGTPVTPDTQWAASQVSGLPERSQPTTDTPQQPNQFPNIPFFPGLRDGGTPRGDNSADGPRQWPKHGAPAGEPHPDTVPLGGRLPSIQPAASPGPPPPDVDLTPYLPEPERKERTGNAAIDQAIEALQKQQAEATAGVDEQIRLLEESNAPSDAIDSLKRLREQISKQFDDNIDFVLKPFPELYEGRAKYHDKNNQALPSPGTSGNFNSSPLPDWLLIPGLPLIGRPQTPPTPGKNPTPYKAPQPPNFNGPTSPCQGNACMQGIGQTAQGNSNKLDRLLAGANLGAEAAGTAEILRRLDKIDNKLGPQIPGGLSGFLKNLFKGISRVADWLQIDRALNALTFITVLHNAYFLSNALSQTLFSAVSNSLAIFGIKDSEGSPLEIGSIVSKYVDGLAKQAIGVENVDGIKAAWKKYSRIYQAASNLLFSMQSIFWAISEVLEIIGENVNRIGNALKKWGVVGEKAYGWMNEKMSKIGPGGRFDRAIQGATEVTDNIDEIASEVLDGQETVSELGKQKAELEKAIKENPPKPQIQNQPVQEAADASKTTSQSPAIAPVDEIKPES